jgi:hypothetical protein
MYQLVHMRVLTGPSLNCTPEMRQKQIFELCHFVSPVLGFDLLISFLQAHCKIVN